MKKQHVLFYLVLLILVSCNNDVKQTAQNEFLINGKIKGLHGGSIKLVSYNEDDRTSHTIDSTAFQNDSFALKGKVDFAQMVSLVVEPGNWSLPLFVENSQINIQGDTTGSEHFDWTAYGGSKGASLKTYTISGSKSNDDYLSYQNDAGLKKYDAHFKQFGKQIDSLSKTNIDAEYKVRDQMDSLEKVLQNDQLNYIQNYQAKNPSSSVGAYLLSQVYMFISNKPVSRIDSILNKFEGDAKNSEYYKSVVSSQDKIKALLPGKPAPDFTLLKRDSTKFTLSSLRGKYAMIDFWASWCHPCRQAIPHWKEVYQKYHDKGFNIVSVSDDARWSDWFKAMDQEKMPWEQVCDEFPLKNMPARIGTLYMTTYIPFYVLLDKDGKILVYSGKEDDIDNKLKEIFGS